jgi:hypothetical protein
MTEPTPTITDPTKGRIEEITAHVGFNTSERVVYAGIIVGVHPHGVVDLVTFGANSVYHNGGVPYDGSASAMTWRYPSISRDTLDLDESGRVLVPLAVDSEG